MNNYTIIDSCRLCKDKNIKEVMSFKNVPLANSYPINKDDKEDLYPLTLVKCENCGHVQLKETISPEILFNNYSYSSSDSPMLVKHFEEYAKDIVGTFKLNEYDQILEIGMNDGVLLREFEKLYMIHLIGVEPATNICEIAKKKTSAKIINKFFNLKTAIKIKEIFGKCNIICCNNTFAHISDLDGVMQGIKKVISPKGIFIFENAYLLDTIKNLYFDQIYHEHLQYYGIIPLIKYLSKYDMEIFDIKHTNIQGGSFRIYVRNKDNYNFPIQDSVTHFISREKQFCLYENKTYDDFYLKLNQLKIDLSKLINQIIKENKTISCYGCPAKFALFSKFFELDNKIIKYVVDDSLLKQGKFSSGQKIPIVNREYMYNNPTDYCFISAWNMSESIINKNKDYKGKFIIPMPEPKII